MKLPSRNRAFSLIELMIVVTILGILVVVTIPTWQRAQSIRTMEKRSANLRTLNMTGDRVTLADPTGRVVRFTNPVTGVVNETWAPGWIDLFPDQVGSTEADDRARADAVAEYFLDNAWLPSHLRGVMDLEGIGFRYGQFYPAEVYIPQ